MSIDFDNKDSRQNYLNEKLDNLLSGINSTYGQVLLDELIIRLQRTLEDFKEEFQGMMGDLKDSSDRRNQIMHDLMEGKEASISENDSAPSSDDVSGPDTSEMSEWERRLEGK